MSNQYVSLIWLCLKPPWGGGGFDITQAKESSSYLLPTEMDRDLMQAHAKTAMACLKALGELLKCPAAQQVRAKGLGTMMPQAAPGHEEGTTVYAAGWGLLWRLTKAFLTQPVLPSSLADGVLCGEENQKL